VQACRYLSINPLDSYLTNDSPPHRSTALAISTIVPTNTKTQYPVFPPYQANYEEEPACTLPDRQRNTCVPYVPPTSATAVVSRLQQFGTPIHGHRPARYMCSNSDARDQACKLKAGIFHRLIRTRHSPANRFVLAISKQPTHASFCRVERPSTALDGMIDSVVVCQEAASTVKSLRCAGCSRRFDHFSKC